MCTRIDCPHHQLLHEDGDAVTSTKHPTTDNSTNMAMRSSVQSINTDRKLESLRIQQTIGIKHAGKWILHNHLVLGTSTIKYIRCCTSFDIELNCESYIIDIYASELQMLNIFTSIDS